MTEISIQRPDDWHLHFRDGDMLAETVPATARCFRRAIAMPNLVPPVATAALAVAYRERISAAIPGGSGFEPLMTLYLTNGTRPEDIHQARAVGVIAAKLYPAGGTTNSAAARDPSSLMIALCERPIPARASAASNCGNDNPPMIARFFRKLTT